MEEELALSDGEVVLAPVPELPEVLVVQGIERVVPADTHTASHSTTHRLQSQNARGHSTHSGLQFCFKRKEMNLRGSRGGVDL